MQPTGLKLYWLAMRPFAFTASVTPVLLGTAIAVAATGTIQWLEALLAMIGAMSIHAVSNLVGDRYDLQKGLDRPDNFGKQNILLKGWMTQKAHTVELFILLIVSIAIAVYFVAAHGTTMLAICIFGLFAAVFYTAPPLNYKYIGLGDLGVFLSFGTFMTLGAYYIQTHELSWLPALYAIPVGLLVDAILHSNNYRDIRGDRSAGITTLASFLGESGARMMYYVLVVGAYVSIPVMILFAKLSPFALLTFITLPVAMKVVKKVASKEKLDPNVFGMIDVETAQLHMMFGLLLTISIVVSHFVGV